MPLFDVIDNDFLTWWPENSIIYSVEAAYKLILQNLLYTTHLQKLKVPPKVKNLLWRDCHDCLPTHANLNHCGLNIQNASCAFL